jgi:multidrug efflux pump subunit AcrA (membrane-fusion protein)
MKIRALVLPLAAVISLIYAGVSIARTTPARVLTEPPQPPPRSSFEHTVAASGLIEPSSENIAIGSAHPGLVTRVHVVAGQRIEIDAPLFTIDHRQLLAQKEMAMARVARAKAAKVTTEVLLEQATRRLASAKSLADSRAISAEETADRASEKSRLEAELVSSLADIRFAAAELGSIETDIERSTVRAPLTSTVLQVRIREGEFIDGSTSASPRLILGVTDPLHVRADIDEFEIPRILENAPAAASPRGNAGLSYDLEFVRFEPYVIPKASLTGDSSERVDTRVLQAIYRIKSPDSNLFTGQQVDVFLEAKARTKTDP